MTELLLIRHGETDFNREGRFQGQVDVPLNERGRRQAGRLAAQLASERRIDALHCSDLLRARQTAEPAARALGLPALADARLREQHFGILEGLTFAEVRERHAEPFERWARFDARYALPGGESTHDFHARAIDAIRDLAARHAGRRVALVTHGGVLDMVWRAAHGLPLDGPRACLIPNAGLSRLHVDAERLEITGWGEDAHLADLRR
jgi:probable phosphoglycerate mutase